MNKILIPKNPDESIILPPLVDFREWKYRHFHFADSDEPWVDDDHVEDSKAYYAPKPSKQEGQE